MNTKTELYHTVAEELGCGNKNAQLYTNAVLDGIKRLSKENITLIGFGTFRVVDVPERTRRNPQTGENMVIPARRRVKFKAGKTFMDEIQTG